MPYKQFTIARLPQPLRKPILVDLYGVPRYWATIWSSIFTHHLEVNSESKKLRHIESLYSYADQTHSNGYLDDILTSCDIGLIGDLLEGYFISLRNQSKTTDATELRWQTSFTFVKDILSHISKNKSKSFDVGQIESRLHHLGMLYAQLRIQKSKRPDILRSLPSDVVSSLYDILDLSNEEKRNPFKSSLVRWNAFLTFICMLHWGLRRGEVLLLPVDVIRSQYDQNTGKTKYWINVIKTEELDDVDSRYNKPSIKTEDSIRQIPISEIIANLIQTYTENYRGKPPHPFLFNTQWNTGNPPIINCS